MCASDNMLSAVASYLMGSVFQMGCDSWRQAYAGSNLTGDLPWVEVNPLSYWHPAALPAEFSGGACFPGTEVHQLPNRRMWSVYRAISQPLVKSQANAKHHRQTPESTSQHWQSILTLQCCNRGKVQDRHHNLKLPNYCWRNEQSLTKKQVFPYKCKSFWAAFRPTFTFRMGDAFRTFRPREDKASEDRRQHCPCGSPRAPASSTVRENLCGKFGCACKQSPWLPPRICEVEQVWICVLARQESHPLPPTYTFLWLHVITQGSQNNNGQSPHHRRQSCGLQPPR